MSAIAKPEQPEPAGPKLIRKLAKAIGPLLVREYTAGKALHEYSKNIHLNVTEDTYQRNLKIRRRAYLVARAKREQAILELKVAMRVQDL